ncbi:hypothetical protein [Phaeobacter gallaeciensis]|uniref:hypothetical protein n=1 Tax=Phaeobacter gallaeciensis TaxID=60890 RepID=UPI00237F7450|nr:hypothetical protein [Phaeobacter gallaeciensis]MDE4193109.1 hypothetical protein [Phaeobacter gallaeciensis]MDE4201450.1 hypothetical protein [Phaeobacter gallaeciensis]MDE4205630.1 hypothetical protein [Phaeobacter gallaeciensis]MDE4209746.1 hypothetical protein [Phaeobacter gallaeciensis]MDE4218154.1 hypothetical protein [Phaeobacter gallaeciensis]
MSGNLVRRIIKALARRPQFRFVIKWALADSDDYPKVLAETMAQNPDAFVRAIHDDPAVLEALLAALRQAEGGDALPAILATALARDTSLPERILLSPSVFDAIMQSFHNNPEAMFRFLSQEHFRQALGAQKDFLSYIAADHILMEKIIALIPSDMRDWMHHALDNAPDTDALINPEGQVEIGPHQALAIMLSRPLNPKDDKGQAEKEEAAMALVQALTDQKVRLLRAVNVTFQLQDSNVSSTANAMDTGLFTNHAGDATYVEKANKLNIRG